MEATRAVNRFEVISEYVPSGDQPEASIGRMHTTALTCT